MELIAKYQLWETYSVELLRAIRTEIVFWERWFELPIIDKIIAEKLEQVDQTKK